MVPTEKQMNLNTVRPCLYTCLEKVYSWSFTVVKLFTSRKVRTKMNTQYKKKYLNANTISVLTNSFQELWILSHFKVLLTSKLLELLLYHFHNCGLWSNYFVSQTYNPKEWCMQYLDCVTDSMFKRTKITALKQQVL